MAVARNSNIINWESTIAGNKHNIRVNPNNQFKFTFYVNEYENYVVSCDHTTGRPNQISHYFGVILYPLKGEGAEILKSFQAIFDQSKKSTSF